MGTIRHDKEHYNCACPVCNKKFHCKPYHLKKFKTHYCSKECQNEARKEYMRGEGNHQYGLKGDKNASWKSDRRISKYGYVQIRSIGHPFADEADFVFEHRLVAEKNLLTNENSVEIDGKRYLSPEYIVHHKDHNRQNNCVDNLVVMKKSDHSRIHATEDIEDRLRDEFGRLLPGKLVEI